MLLEYVIGGELFSLIRRYISFCHSQPCDCSAVNQLPTICGLCSATHGRRNKLANDHARFYAGEITLAFN